MSAPSHLYTSDREWGVLATVVAKAIALDGADSGGWSLDGDAAILFFIWKVNWLCCLLCCSSFVQLPDYLSTGNKRTYTVKESRLQ